MFRRTLNVIGTLIAHQAVPEEKKYSDKDALCDNLEASQQKFYSTIGILKKCFKDNPSDLKKCNNLAEELEKQLKQISSIDETKRFHIHDLDDKEEKVGTADTFDDAMNVAAVDAMKNWSRSYAICEGSCKENNSLWFGDSWSMQQYYREHGNLRAHDMFARNNIRRMLGDPYAEVTPTSEPEVYGVKLKP